MSALPQGTQNQERLHSLFKRLNQLNLTSDETAKLHKVEKLEYAMQDLEALITSQQAGATETIGFFSEEADILG